MQEQEQLQLGLSGRCSDSVIREGTFRTGSLELGGASNRERSCRCLSCLAVLLEVRNDRHVPQLPHFDTQAAS